jgi:hypothetical protein
VYINPVRKIGSSGAFRVVSSCFKFHVHVSSVIAVFIHSSVSTGLVSVAPVSEWTPTPCRRHPRRRSEEGDDNNVSGK